jgi:hypothetical protein
VTIGAGLPAEMKRRPHLVQESAEGGARGGGAEHAHGPITVGLTVRHRELGNPGCGHISIHPEKPVFGSHTSRHTLHTVTARQDGGGGGGNVDFEPALGGGAPSLTNAVALADNFWGQFEPALAGEPAPAPALGGFAAGVPAAGGAAADGGSLLGFYRRGGAEPSLVGHYRRRYGSGWAGIRTLWAASVGRVMQQVGFSAPTRPACLRALHRDTPPRSNLAGLGERPGGSSGPRQVHPDTALHPVAAAACPGPLGAFKRP